MKKNLLIFIISLFGYSNLTAQENLSENKVQEAFASYFKLSRESIFLHLNKSTYIVGEDIWFKGYIYNRQNNSPFKETSNIYVGIYDSRGKQIDKKLYLSENGYTEGSIIIDSTFSSGEYYIKASTNWMRNFTEDDSFIQKIKIYNESQTKNKPSEVIDYDVQFLPEGGNLISGVQNTVGVKVINPYGYGVNIEKGIVKDENDILVSQFEGSVFGLTKFNITPEHTKKYKVILKFEDKKEITYPLLTAKREGIGIIVKNTSKDKVMFVLSSNKATREKISGQRFFILIHQDGIANKIEVTFLNDKPYIPFVIEKKSLEKGVNIITLLDNEGKPILERLFFNYYDLHFSDVQLEHTNTENDSLAISLKVYSKNNIIKNMSVSVLPENTRAYKHANNILSVFLLKPYIKGFIEDPSYYFKNITSRKENELDLLLLTQGWSRYNWDDIFNNPPKQLFEFEQGIALNGTINTKMNKKDKILLHSTKKKTSQVIDIIQNENKFNLLNFFPERNEKINFSLIKNNGNLIKPIINLSLKLNKIIDRINYPWSDNIKEIVLQDTSSYKNVSNLISSENVTELDEVVLVQNVGSQNSNVPYIYRNKVTKVTEEVAKSYPEFTDIIRKRGYDLRINGLAGGDRVRVVTRIPLSLTQVATNANIPLPSPLIYLDGIRLVSFDVLYELHTSEVESFFIDRSGNGEGGGGAGVIRIYTKNAAGYKFIEDKAKSEKVYEYVTDKGFEKTKQFYVPRYKTYLDKAFENFGVIHWLPEIITNEKGEATFNILDTKLENISFFIEGMGDDGSLLSTVKTVNFNSRH